MINNKIALKLGILFIPFLLFVFIGKVSAQKNNTSALFTVSPPMFDFWANPGDSLTQYLRIVNNSENANKFVVRMENFESSGEEGFIYVLDPQPGNTYSLSQWIKVSPNNFLLNPKEAKVISFTVEVPKDAEPGGRYASIIIEADNNHTEQKSERPNIVSLVMIKVSGDIRERAAIESFTSPGYLERPVVPLEFRVKNTGNIHIKPKGNIVITNILGRIIAEIPLSDETVLPNAVRNIKTQWKHDKFLAGRYTATLVATYGEKNDKSFSASTSFIVLSKPTAFSVVVIVIFLGLVISGKINLKKILHNFKK